MFFIGIVTDKNSENNIKNLINNRIEQNGKIIFLNKDNVSNFKNVKFDSLVLNEKIDGENIINNIFKNSKYILLNYDIHYKSECMKNISNNVITYGYNSKATVTISSATEDNYMFYIQENISNRSNIEGIQEVKFEKSRNNINAYDGMIITIMEMLYSK